MSGKTVVIQNTGSEDSAILSITNIKVTHNEQTDAEVETVSRYKTNKIKRQVLRMTK